MMKVHIEKGVPLPTKRLMMHQYPFHSMKVGDSFTVPLEGDEAKLRGRLLQAARRAGVQITQRKQDNGTLRIWRMG